MSKQLIAQYNINTLLLMLLGFLSLLMVAGMTLYQAGMVRAKNANTIILKNFSAIAMVFIIYLLFGHQMMYGTVQTAKHSNHFAVLFFHLMPPCMVLSIIAASTAERMKIWPFLIFSVIMVAGIYPIQGQWIWGNGFLHQFGFVDQAGAGMVFLTGATAGLIGVLLLGPRYGKYSSEGEVLPLRAANIPLASMGIMLIWIGCYGFLSGVHSLNAKLVSMHDFSLIAINICSAAAAALLAAMLVTRIFYGFTDLTLVFNGLLAGIVIISAAPVATNIHITMLLGLAAGITVVVSAFLLDKLRIDDPIGAISSFGVIGILGLFAALLNPNLHNGANTWWHQLLAQAYGAGVIIAWVGITSTITWLAIKFLIGIRVSEEEEIKGLDIVDCGMPAYPEFTLSD